MNKQNTPQPISRAKLFSLLAARAEDSAPHPEEKQGAIRSLDIPQDLSKVLDELIILSEDTLKRQPAGTLSEILRLGIHAWYNQLNNEAKASLGLQEPVQDDQDDDQDDPSPAMAQQQADAYAQAMGTVGYTPMTIHSLSANGNSKQSNQQRSKKRVPAGASPDRRRRNKNRGRRR